MAESAQNLWALPGLRFSRVATPTLVNGKVPNSASLVAILWVVAGPRRRVRFGVGFGFVREVRMLE